MAAGILLTLMDPAANPIGTIGAIDGNCFRKGEEDQAPHTFSLPTNDLGYLTIPVDGVFSVGEEVWVEVHLGSILDPPNWQAHFALHRVQEF